jgi:hypothetical protein
MINIGFGLNMLLGFIILVSVLLLYFLRTIKYEISRDFDILFTTLGFIYGMILIVHGWRLDPILLFGQILIIYIVLTFGWENLRLRALMRDFNESADDYTKS